MKQEYVFESLIASGGFITSHIILQPIVKKAFGWQFLNKVDTLLNASNSKLRYTDGALVEKKENSYLLRMVLGCPQWMGIFVTQKMLYNNLETLIESKNLLLAGSFIGASFIAIPVYFLGLKLFFTPYVKSRGFKEDFLPVINNNLYPFTGNRMLYCLLVGIVGYYFAKKNSELFWKKSLKGLTLSTVLGMLKTLSNIWSEYNLEVKKKELEGNSIMAMRLNRKPSN